jgi:Flp pilus assembly pilin Flp
VAPDRESFANASLTIIFSENNLLNATHVHFLSPSQLPVRVYQGIVVTELFVRFVKNDSGATSTEVGLIAAGISLSIIMIMLGLATRH